MFDVSNNDVWKFKMSMYLKTLGLHVYLATTKKSYLGNAQALVALRHTLSKDYLCMIFHCDSAFAVWNTLTSPSYKRQTMWKKKSSGEESDQACFMVQGNDSLEVILKTHFLLKQGQVGFLMNPFI